MGVRNGPTKLLLLSGLVSCRNRRRKRLQEFSQFNKQVIDIHSMHECPIFQSVKVHGETFATTHLQIAEKANGFGVCADDCVYRGIFIDDKHEFGSLFYLPLVSPYASIESILKQ